MSKREAGRAVAAGEAAGEAAGAATPGSEPGRAAPAAGSDGGPTSAMAAGAAAGAGAPGDAAPVAPVDAAMQEKLDALAGRAAFYDLLAALYYKPLSAEQVENVAAMDLSAYADVSALFAEGLDDMARYLRRRNTGTRQELAVDFTAAFAGTSSWKGRYAVPYESVFTSAEGLMYQDAYHEVYQTYRLNRVQRGPGYDCPDDHLSFMCEFLAVLSTRAAGALRAGDVAGALENLRVSREFLDAHVLSWFDDFQELALKLLKTRFYRGLLKATKAFFLFDAQVLDELSAGLA